MEKIKLAFFTIVFLAVVGALGYWAFGSLETGEGHVVSQRVKELESENRDLKKEIEDLKNEIRLLKPEIEEPEITDEPVVEEPGEPEVYKHQELINELQELINDNVSMKLKSRGTRVGTIQKFLNLYNNTNNRIDNDYGNTTVKLVTAFQKAEGISPASGETNPTTYQKMIDWLKKQG